MAVVEFKRKLLLSSRKNEYIEGLGTDRTWINADSCAKGRVMRMMEGARVTPCEPNPDPSRNYAGSPLIMPAYESLGCVPDYSHCTIPVYYPGGLPLGYKIDPEWTPSAKPPGRSYRANCCKNPNRPVARSRHLAILYEFSRDATIHYTRLTNQGENIEYVVYGSYDLKTTKTYMWQGVYKNYIGNVRIEGKYTWLGAKPYSLNIYVNGFFPEAYTRIGLRYADVFARYARVGYWKRYGTWASARIFYPTGDVKWGFEGFNKIKIIGLVDLDELNREGPDAVQILDEVKFDVAGFNQYLPNISYLEYVYGDSLVASKTYSEGYASFSMTTYGDAGEVGIKVYTVMSGNEVVWGTDYGPNNIVKIPLVLGIKFWPQYRNDLFKLKSPLCGY